MFRQRYADAMNEPRWDSIPSEPSPLYPWQPDSTYIRLPTFFSGLSAEPQPISSIDNARVLLKTSGTDNEGQWATPGSLREVEPTAAFYLSDEE